MRDPGLFADGQGLYLRIDQTGSRRWVFIYYRLKKRREMGLGSAEVVKLAQARQAAEEARAALKAGADPITARRAAMAPAADHTFSGVASDLLDELEKGWRSPKQRPQWEASLKQHAPALWSADVSAIDTEAVLSALRPIWTKSPETATRIRARIERVLDAAKARGLREGENPARWRGHLDNLLSRTRRKKGHHAAMPYGDVPDFLKALATRDSISAEALRFLIFTVARSGEIRGATWEEIQGDIWVIPAERMKAEREHRVPLSPGAMAVLESVSPVLRQGLIFPGAKGLLSDMALAMVMRKLDVNDATPHGFRSAFKDWAMDCTNFPDEVSEEALAHVVGSAVRRAYRRGEAIEKRRALMEAWSAFCLGQRGSVVAFRA
ncbi:site-specific integrase [Brevundimonas sp. S30B]|nr:site-specific integrase [Brevundimonas sp. MF30-B]TFW01401.1 site-specific integrase [Brevundimonas sp. S30B]